MADAWLLLLPAPPSEVSLDTFQVAYKPTLTVILRDASEQTKTHGRNTQLDIGIAFANVFRLSYSRIQAVLALSYQLVCILSTDLGIDVQHDNDVDIRVFLFQDRKDTRRDVPGDSPVLPTFESVAQSTIPWSRLCFVHSELGEGMLREIVSLRDKKRPVGQSEAHVVRLPGGLSMVDAGKEQLSQDHTDPFPQYSSVAVGGTFDHLHAGHKLLLTVTAMLCRHSQTASANLGPCLTIGITGDELLKSKEYREQLEDWNTRQAGVKRFISDYLKLFATNLESSIADSDTSTPGGRRQVVDTLNSGLRVRYVEIVDPYGPTIEDYDISALVVSAETRSGGDSVNVKRQEKGWPPLKTFEVHVLDAGKPTWETPGTARAVEFASKMSSTQIRSRIHDKLARSGQGP